MVATMAGLGIAATDLKRVRVPNQQAPCPFTAGFRAASQVNDLAARGYGGIQGILGRCDPWATYIDRSQSSGLYYCGLGTTLWTYKQSMHPKDDLCWWGVGEFVPAKNNHTPSLEDVGDMNALDVFVEDSLRNMIDSGDNVVWA